MPLQHHQSTAKPGGLHDLFAPFRCTSSRGGVYAVWVEASGDLDVLTTPQLERALRDAAVASPRLVVLDLHALTFIDSSGVHAIEDAGLQARRRGGRLVVSRAPTHVARIMTLTGTSSIVELIDVGAMPDHLRLVR